MQRISRHRAPGILCSESWIRELNHLRLKPKHHQKYSTQNGIRRQAAKTSRKHLPIHQLWLPQLKSSIQPPICDQSREGRVLLRHHRQQHPIKSKDIPGRPLSRLTPTPTPTHRQLWRSPTTSSLRGRRPPGRRYRTYKPRCKLSPGRKQTASKTDKSDIKRMKCQLGVATRQYPENGPTEPKICRYIAIDSSRYLAADTEAQCQILRRARRHLLFRVLRDLESL